MKRVLLIAIIVLVLGVVFVSSAAAQTINAEPYRIQPGDTLSSIAIEYCTIWQDIYRYNAGIIGSDPNALEVGTLIYVIDRCGQNNVYDRGPSLHAMGTVNGQYYTVAAGDTLYSISRRFGLNYQIIMGANGLTSTSIVTPGTALYIPGFKEDQEVASITINSPVDGEVYRLPYTASGTASGLAGSVIVANLLDSNGSLMSQQQTSLQKDGSWYVTFSSVVGQPKSNGSIEAFSLETGATAVSYFLFSGW